MRNLEKVIEKNYERSWGPAQQARNQLAWDDNSAIVPGAGSLAELQLRIYWHKGVVRWMKCKIRLALVGYLIARS